MLYVSTRNKTDSFTAHRALHEEHTPDGGMFVPFQLPQLSAEELRALQRLSFSETVAYILNLFFSAHISSWDVEFCIGRYPIKIESLNQRVIAAELWHNTEGTYAHMVQSINKMLCSGNTASNLPAHWVRMAVAIAILFGIFGEMQETGIDRADIAVSDGEYLFPVAAWYARKMGLPVNSIICGCDENDGVWDLLYRGEYSSDADTAPRWSLEHLIYGTFGTDGVKTFSDACNSGRYCLDEVQMHTLNRGFFAAMIGDDRTNSVIRSIYRTNTYVVDSATAAAYGALQDYRARTGENRHTLLLAENSPLRAERQIAAVLGCSQEQLKSLVCSTGE